MDVPDPTDWLDTPVQDLTRLESALHCQICKDIYTTPMITTCNHTFCSLCIRKCLTEGGKCPACRETIDKEKLKNSWVVQDVVDAFRLARPAILQLAKGAKEDEVPRKRKRRRVEDSEAETEDSTPPKTERRPQRRSSRRQAQESFDNDEFADSDEEKEREREQNETQDDGLSACPICNKRMKVEDVFRHLDVHNDPTGSTKASSSSKSAKFYALLPKPQANNLAGLHTLQMVPTRKLLSQWSEYRFFIIPS